MGDIVKLDKAARTATSHRAIAGAAARSGVDFGYLLDQAKIESGLDPAAKARTSTASGLYQFTQQTWLATLKRHGADHGLGWAADAITTSGGRFGLTADMRQAVLDLRFDPDASAAMAAAFASDNDAYLSARLGRRNEPVDLYLAHFLGAAGAARFLTAHAANPDTAAAPLFPAAAGANRSIFYDKSGEARTLGQIRDNFAAKFEGNATPPSAQVRFALKPPAPAPMRVGQEPERPPLQMRPIEQMPGRLSLALARTSYERLAALGQPA